MMNNKNDSKVLIDGKIYTISGYESEEYIQKVALYINKKMEEVRLSDNGKRLNTRLQSILTLINIADDYYKLLNNKIDPNKNADRLLDQNHNLEKEIERLNFLVEEKNKVIASQQKEIDIHNNKVRDCRQTINRKDEIIAEITNTLNAKDKIIIDLENDVERFKLELDEYIELFENGEA